MENIVQLFIYIYSPGDLHIYTSIKIQITVSDAVPQLVSYSHIFSIYLKIDFGDIVQTNTFPLLANKGV